MGFLFIHKYTERGWTELRLWLKKFGVDLPTRNEIDSEKKKLAIPLTKNVLKASADFQDVLKNTASGNFPTILIY